MQINGWM